VAKNQLSPLQEKLCVGSKNSWHLLELSWLSLVSMQSLREIELRAPAVGAKIGVFCMSRLVCMRVRDIVQTSIVWRFMGRFWWGFQRFSQNRLLFQMHYIVVIFVAKWRHNFPEIAVKNCEKSKNRQKSLCAPLRIDSWEIWRQFKCSSLGPRM